LARGFGNKFSIAAHCSLVSLIAQLNDRAALQRKCLSRGGIDF
jgi:hypothetical protein